MRLPEASAPRELEDGGQRGLRSVRKCIHRQIRENRNSCRHQCALVSISGIRSPTFINPRFRGFRHPNSECFLDEQNHLHMRKVSPNDRLHLSAFPDGDNRLIKTPCKNAS